MRCLASTSTAQANKQYSTAFIKMERGPKTWEYINHLLQQLLNLNKYAKLQMLSGLELATLGPSSYPRRLLAEPEPE